MFNMSTRVYIHVFDDSGYHYRLHVPSRPNGFDHYRQALEYIDSLREQGTPLPDGASPVHEYQERKPCSFSRAVKVNPSESVMMSK